MNETAKEHAIRTKHSVTESVNTPWKCLVCDAKSPLYDLKKD